MLVLDLIIIALIALGAFSGHKKGLVGILVSFASLILAIVLAFVLQSVVADALYNLGFGETVSDIVQENMQEIINNGEDLNDSFYGKIISGSITDDKITEASEAVAKFVMKGLSFIAIFLIVHIICYILQMVLNLVFNLPGLSSINELGGTILGALSVLIKIWIILAILSFIAPLPMFSPVMEYINKTILTKLLYNNNLLVAIIKIGLKI